MVLFHGFCPSYFHIFYDFPKISADPNGTGLWPWPPPPLSSSSMVKRCPRPGDVASRWRLKRCRSRGHWSHGPMVSIYSFIHLEVDRWID